MFVSVLSMKNTQYHFHQMISVCETSEWTSLAVGVTHGLSSLCLIVNTKPGWIRHVWKADLLSFFQA